MQPIAVIASGMVTGVGLSAPASCAAIRAHINNFGETRFMDRGGQWIMGSQVPLEQPWRGREKIVRMAAAAIAECLPTLPVPAAETTVILCVAEEGRPGRFAELDLSLIADIEERLRVKFHQRSSVLPGGRAGGVEAIRIAREELKGGRPACIFGGADTYLAAPTLAVYEETHRLLTSKNSDGFIPGEAGAALVLVPADRALGDHVLCGGVGLGMEKSLPGTDVPLRADGLVEATRAALAEEGIGIADTDFRYTDASGEQRRFKEAALLLTRLLRTRKEAYEIMHPADCIGEVGAAVLPCILSCALAATVKRYEIAPTALCHLGNEAGERAALILRHVRAAAPSATASVGRAA